VPKHVVGVPLTVPISEQLRIAPSRPALHVQLPVTGWQ
jgi:hypothetical protein